MSVALEAMFLQLVITYLMRAKAHFPGEDLISQMNKRSYQQEVLLATIHIVWIEGS